MSHTRTPTALAWQIESGSDHQQHKAECRVENSQTLNTGLIACADYAFSLWPGNVNDDSLYCLFDWQHGSNTLTISVLNGHKQAPTEHIVSCRYTFESTDLVIEPEQVKAWISNHLTTSAEFFVCSLVAIFSVDGDVDNGELL